MGYARRNCEPGVTAGHAVLPLRRLMRAAGRGCVGGACQGVVNAFIGDCQLGVAVAADSYAGKDYSYRKEWLSQSSQIFSIEVCATRC